MVANGVESVELGMVGIVAGMGDGRRGRVAGESLPLVFCYNTEKSISILKRRYNEIDHEKITMWFIVVIHVL